MHHSMCDVLVREREIERINERRVHLYTQLGDVESDIHSNTGATHFPTVFIPYLSFWPETLIQEIIWFSKFGPLSRPRYKL